MTDSHIHIGQFKDVYYDPIEVTEIVMSAGMEGMSFSSTSSCKDNVLYSEIEKEITSFLSRIPYSDEVIRPFFWYIPDYINQNITPENASSCIPYKGIKIHPFSQHWDFNVTQHMEILHSLFEYAARNNLPVLIHTGHSGVDSANRFECFIDEYRYTKFILAHCRPLDVTIEMLKKYNNVYCDTSFAPKSDIRQLTSSGFRDKIIFGSDFPVTHFFKTKYPNPCDNSSISLKEQYAEDIAYWEMLEAEFTIGIDGE
ncbi:MAG: amidohydrolase family protein [Prevotellaceae bacterium]|jgi:hypothetical protein|nr:amidohydrolase family protein [Prevotellaceae bacterium]